ncbi:MAG: flagellar hook-basal body complex protein [Pseudomonadota bacterium]
MSLDIALSGIQAINEQLGTISNNIANAGTYGFKASRANFSAQYAGDQAAGTRIGSTTQSIDLNGGVVSTGRALDASINGRGFFVSKDMQGQTNYSRAGIFNADSNGFLSDSSGRRVQGFSMKPPSTLLGPMGDLTIPTGQVPAVATTKLTYVTNLSADWSVPIQTAWTEPVAADPAQGITEVLADPTAYNMSRVSVAYDTLGTQHTITQYFVKSATPNVVTVHYAVDGVGNGQTTDLTFNSDGSLLSTGAPVTPEEPATFALTINPVNGATDPLTLKVDYKGTTQFAGEATTSSNQADGYASGTFTGVELAPDGSLVAKYTNGQKQAVGKLAIATFPDEGALIPVNETSWQASTASGTPLYTTPGVGMAGALSTGSLEQSNVDITAELVGLMTAQRNYQANSKVLQTESTILQSLMQAM